MIKSPPLGLRLPQEPVVNIRTVNCHVAARATLVARIDHAVRGVIRVRDAAVGARGEVTGTGMALEALQGNGWAVQQLGIGRAMGPVTGDAPVNLAGLVFED